MAFDDVRLPDDIERGAVGGPQFRSQVSQLESGFEQRNQLWSQPLGGWDISYGVADAADIMLIRDFFYARRGRLRGFRFKDWTDFEIGNVDDAVNDFQQIGVGDDAQATFQVYKRYSSGGQDFDRIIKKLVTGRVVVLIDGVVDATAGVNVDTGVVTPTAVPTAGQLVQVACEFDVPVRFQSDKLDLRAELFDVQSIPAINLVEDRLP